LIKTLSKAQKMEREKFRIPRSVQDAIPIRRIFADGIFQVGNQYSKTWSFTDINYAIASKEDKTVHVSRLFGTVECSRLRRICENHDL
jgi:hypothetical protein